MNSHFHSNQNFLRGRYPGRPLESLMLYAYPFDPTLAQSPELVYLRTLVVAIEALRNGVTCLLDDCIELPSQDHEQLAAVFRAYEDVGIRANCSGHVINKPVPGHASLRRRVPAASCSTSFDGAPPPTTEEYLEFATEAVRRFQRPAGRLRYVVAPSGPQRCTDDLLAAAPSSPTATTPPTTCTCSRPRSRWSPEARALRQEPRRAPQRDRRAQPSADDGARDLDHRRGHRADGGRGLLGGPQPGLQPADRRWHRAVARAARRRASTSRSEPTRSTATTPGASST